MAARTGRRSLINKTFRPLARLLSRPLITNHHLRGHRRGRHSSVTTTYGTGVYKSVDAGKNWKNIGLRDTRQIGALIVHPNNPDIVLVAALGKAFGPNPERGIFGRATAARRGRKFFQDEEYRRDRCRIRIRAIPNVVFASLWQARRQPWFFSSGGPGQRSSTKSEDNGVTWKQLAGNGLPEGILGIIGISVSGADSNRVYAIIEAKEGGIFRSDDGGGRNGPRSMTTAGFVSAPGISIKFTRTKISRYRLCAQYRRIQIGGRR